MLPQCPAVRSAITRLIPLLTMVVLIVGCGDGAGLSGPDVRTDAEASGPALAMEAAGRQAINIEFGDFAVHVPANVKHVRGVVIALGGPDTRGFAVGTPFGAPFPEVEAALQDFGARLRDLAGERGLAVLGSGRFGPSAFPNDPVSDQTLLDAVAEAAVLTGHPELLDAPFLMYGASGGGPEAVGFTDRHPERVIALHLKVPVSAGPLTGDALKVPAYMVLAEFDVWVDNAALAATFEGHRAAGAPWAAALEPGVVHHSYSLAQRELTVDWMRAVLAMGPDGTGRQPSVENGWLGDPDTGDIARVGQYAGDLTRASWFPKRRLAEAWATFVGF